MSGVSRESTSASDGYRSHSVLAFLALATAFALPLQTGAQRIADILGLPGPVTALVQGWKELALAALVLASAWILSSGRARIRWEYLPAMSLWCVFFGYLLLYAVVGQRVSVAALYGFRVYAEPIVGGLAIGMALARARQAHRLPAALCAASILVFALAAIQVLMPVAPFVVQLRRTAADAFGDLPNAFTVSVVNQFRPFATFSDPNDYGYFTALAFLATFAPRSDATRSGFLRKLVRVISAIGLTISFSRSALLAFLTGGSVLLALRVFSAPQRVAGVRLRTVLPLALASLLTVTVIGAVAPYAPQLQHLANTVSRADPSAKGHLTSLSGGIREVGRYPAGLGLGLVGPRAGLYGREGKKFHVESSFLQLAAEAGVAGLLLYLLAWIATLTAVVNDSLRDDGKASTGGLARIAAASLVAQAAAYLFLPLIVSLQTGVVVWTTVGLVFSTGDSNEPRRVDGALQVGDN